MDNLGPWILGSSTARPLRIVLPGGSGHVGSMLARFFQERGHHVTVLTRGPYTAPWQTVHWDGVELGPWVETLEGADVCIHLSGRSINCRYTARNCRELYDSRIGPTRLLHRAFATLANPPRIWMNASSASIYRHEPQGTDFDRDMDEAPGELGGNDPQSGRDLTSLRRRAPEKWNWTIDLIKAWEAAFFSVETPRTRKIALRTSLVFGPESGGVFAVLSRLVRFGLGGTQGNGRQYVSWIHEADFAHAAEFLIDHDEIDGPINLAAPHPLPNREFMAALREALDVPNGLPAPAPLIVLGTFFLRSEPELILKSRRVIPGRLLQSGFQFEFPDWAGAAADLVRQWRARDDL
jgi:NAD dependent epimerase/dehydratase family enzyme